MSQITKVTVRFIHFHVLPPSSLETLHTVFNFVSVTLKHGFGSLPTILPIGMLSLSGVDLLVSIELVHGFNEVSKYGWTKLICGELAFLEST